MSKLIESTGFCKYCKQAVMIKALEDATQEELNDIASKECNCKEAEHQRAKDMQFSACKEYVTNLFSDTNPLACIAIIETALAVLNRKIASASFKIGKYTYKIDMDAKQCIRIKKTFKGEDEETF